MAKKVKNLLKNNMVLCVLVLVAIGLTSVVFAADVKIKKGAIYGDELYIDANSLVVDPNGNVGIGTSSPQSHLTIANPSQAVEDINTDGLRIHRTTGSSNSYLQLNLYTGACRLISRSGNIYGDMKFMRYNGTTYGTYMHLDGGTGNIGIGTTDPARSLHIVDVLRLEPRSSAPSSPSEGDLYVNSSDHHFYCYLNGSWAQLD